MKREFSIRDPFRVGLSDLYRLASVFITVSEIETQGLLLQEAQACGLPVVAFNTICIPEVVHDGIHGRLVRPKDVNGLGYCLRRLLEDPVRVRRWVRPVACSYGN